MPIYLVLDDNYNPSGPDGKGRNRLRIDTISPMPRCALRPKTYDALRECQDTQRVKPDTCYDLCTNQGDCQNCPLFKGEYQPKMPEFFGDEIYVREYPLNSSRDWAGQPMAMNKMKDGWGDYAKWGFTWADVMHWPGCYPAKFGRDEHSRWVLIKRLREIDRGV